MPRNYVATPICPRYGRVIENTLPESCPMRARDPIDECRKLKDMGLRILDKHFWDDAAVRIDKADQCYECLCSGILFTRNIKRIREGSGFVNCD